MIARHMLSPSEGLKRPKIGQAGHLGDLILVNEGFSGRAVYC